MQLKVGQIVRLSERGKSKYPDTSSNPYSIKGSVVTANGSSYRVRWSNGKVNGYYREDLTPISSVRGVAKFIRDVEHRYHGKPIEEPLVTPEPKKKREANTQHTLTSYFIIDELLPPDQGY